MGDRWRTQFSGAEPPPLQSLSRLACYPWLVVGTTCIGAFIGQLDASIVQLALPALEHEFSTSLSAVTWVAVAYSLAFAAILPSFSRLSEMYGRKLLYLGGYAGFTIASATCGMVSDLTLLIIFRVIQGVSGALLGANSITILVKGAGAERRGRAMGLFAAAQAVGVSAGPAVGGLLLATLGWRSVFWLSVPFGLAGAVIGWLVLPQSGTLGEDKRFDWWGAILLTPALVSIVIVLSEVHAWGLASPALIGCALVAVVLLPLFIWHEHRAPAPLLDLHLFHIPAFSGGVVAVNLSYALLYAMFFLMSFTFVRGYRDSSISAGLQLAIIPVAISLVAPFSGALYERIGPRIVTSAGMAICIIALVILSTMLGGASGNGIAVLAVLAALALFGVGLGAFIAPNNSTTMASAPDDRTGEAGGMLNLMRALGGSVGVATASSVLSWRLTTLTGTGNRTLATSTDGLLAAVDDVLPLLIGFAIVAGGISLVRSHRKPKAALAMAHSV
jgi:EmrB/QacA subfamily drug resistance transporter